MWLEFIGFCIEMNCIYVVVVRRCIKYACIFQGGPKVLQGARAPRLVLNCICLSYKHLQTIFQCMLTLMYLIIHVFLSLRVMNSKRIKIVKTAINCMYRVRRFVLYSKSHKCYSFF